MPYLLVTLTSLLFCAMHTQAALPMAADSQPLPSLAPMLERVSPAVVNISTRTRIRHEEHPLLRDPVFRWFFDVPRISEQEDSSLGSGVITDAQAGYILTNHHVIDKAHEIQVTLHDGRRLRARLLGADPETDIALLQVPAQDLMSIPSGDSDQLRVGDFVVAIGSPFGLQHSVTSGIVSALGRSGLGIEGYEYFIQTDASINPGNSGGPLVNLRGELVGINTAILAPNGGNIGISFAIPVNMARAVMAQLIEHGEVRRGHFGISVHDLTPDLADAMGLEQRQGALVVRIEAGSPAEQAELREADLVIGLNGKPVHNASQLRNRIGLLPIGSEVELDLIRKGHKHTVRLRIANPLADFIHGEHLHAYLNGALLGEAIREDGTDAVVVGHVEHASNAWQLGLRKGDLILALNREPVENLRQLTLLAVQAGDTLLLRVQRGDRLLRLLAR